MITKQNFQGDFLSA